MQMFSIQIQYFVKFVSWIFSKNIRSQTQTHVIETSSLVIFFFVTLVKMIVTREFLNDLKIN